MPEFKDSKITNVLEENEQDVNEPDMYRVLIHNDHYTTMDFVVEVLLAVFRKQLLEATKIMLDVHRSGVGVAGTYTMDIAKTKTRQVSRMAKAREFPLHCTFEKA